MKRFFHIVFSCWLAVLLLFGSTDKEFFHSFAGHKDTIDRVAVRGHIYFDNLHHHCDFLSFSIAPFVAHHLITPVFFEHKEFIVFNTENVFHIFKKSILLSSLRGPPAFC